MQKNRTALVALAFGIIISGGCGAADDEELSAADRLGFSTETADSWPLRLREGYPKMLAASAQGQCSPEGTLCSHRDSLAHSGELKLVLQALQGRLARSDSIFLEFSVYGLEVQDEDVTIDIKGGAFLAVQRLPRHTAPLRTYALGESVTLPGSAETVYYLVYVLPQQAKACYGLCQLWSENSAGIDYEISARRRAPEPTIPAPAVPPESPREGP